MMHWMDRLTDSLDLNGEVDIGPVVELAGDRSVLIEHHRGIVQYQKEVICVKVKFGIVEICGSGMEITRMTGDQLIISGRIDAINLHRRNE